MEPNVPRTPSCIHCNCEMERKEEVHPHQVDINMQSLLLMFRIHELIVMECKACGHTGMYL